MNTGGSVPPTLQDVVIINQQQQLQLQRQSHQQQQDQLLQVQWQEQQPQQQQLQLQMQLQQPHSVGVHHSFPAENYSAIEYKTQLTLGRNQAQHIVVQIQQDDIGSIQRDEELQRHECILNEQVHHDYVHVEHYQRDVVHTTQLLDHHTGSEGQADQSAEMFRRFDQVTKQYNMHRDEMTMDSTSAPSPIEKTNTYDGAVF